MLTDNFEIECQIGEGGTLLRARPLNGAGRVTIRRLEVSREQDRKEFRRLTSLYHPGLAQARDFLEQDGQHYFV